MRRLATKAYRRELTDDDVTGLMQFYDQGEEQGGFESGVRMGLQALLASPHFIFRMEEVPNGVRPGDIYEIGDADLASRLSFFLWGSPPDQELIELADRGDLQDDDELDRQVERMLDDPRSEALASRFAAQWLRLQDLEDIHPDALSYPYFDETLAEAMHRETELLFDHIVEADRPIIDLLTADYTFVNERLAAHYGIPGVIGPEFRMVDYPNERRRGLLGHGSVLTLTSHASRTSTVLRGKWVMEVLMGAPPPPPPPNVPDLEETEGAEDGRFLTGARAHGAASGQSRVRILPQHDRPHRTGSGELRRGRLLARARRGQPRRSVRRAVRRHAHQRRGRPPRGPAHAAPRCSTGSSRRT